MDSFGLLGCLLGQDYYEAGGGRRRGGVGSLVALFRLGARFDSQKRDGTVGFRGARFFSPNALTQVV